MPPIIPNYSDYVGIVRDYLNIREVEFPHGFGLGNDGEPGIKGGVAEKVNEQTNSRFLGRWGTGTLGHLNICDDLRLLDLRLFALKLCIKNTNACWPEWRAKKSAVPSAA